MTQYWQLVHGYTPLQAGIRLLPHAAVMMIVAPLSARLVEFAGTKRVMVTGLTFMMVGLALLSTISPGSPYPVVISFFMVMGVGMGMTMAPATESIMGALPREKAGVGSAINDTTRQMGGALGVAVIGSVVASVYAGRIADLGAATGLTTPQTTLAQDSLGAAQRVGTTLGARAGDFVAGANEGFVAAMATGMRISIVVIAFAAVMVWRFLPARADAPAPYAPVGAGHDGARDAATG
jgi:MFS family permease